MADLSAPIRSTLHLLNFGPSIKHVTLFLAKFDPSPLSHIPELKCKSHISDSLQCLVGLLQKTRTKAPFTNPLSIVRGGFCPGVLSGGLFSGSFVLGGFCPFPFRQNTSVTTES